MEPEGSLPHSQVPATCPYHQPDRFQSIPPYPTSWTSILILSSHLCLGLPSGLFPSGFPTKTLYTPLLSPYTLHALSLILNFITQTIVGEEYRSLSFSLYSFLHSPVTSSLLGPNFSSTPHSQTPSAYVPPSMWATKFHTHTKPKAILAI